MRFNIIVHDPAADDIARRRVFDQRQIIAAIEEQLRHEPTRQTRRKKCLVGLTPRFVHVLPVWELRVGTYRVFYDVDEAAMAVHVRAVREKRPEQRTEDIT
jgi:mRNA-degrading endonuclease RelE of RelBE toxin-antitoxin system